MNSYGEDLEQKRQRQVDEIHAALGRYVEAFEQLVLWIRAGCSQLTCLLTPGHTGVKQQQLMNVVFHHQSMTANNLLSIYRALVGHIISDTNGAIDEEEIATIKGVLSSFGTAFQNATEMRNDYIHGTWFIGWGNSETEDWSDIGFSRGKTNTKGLQFIEGPKNAKTIDLATSECIRLKSYFLNFNSCFIFGLSDREMGVSTHFVKIKKEWVLKTRATDNGSSEIPSSA